MKRQVWPYNGTVPRSLKDLPMSTQASLATQRHEMDVATSRQRFPVARHRSALSTRLGLALIGAGSRLLADRHGVGRTRG
jgi:hypothetical protein